MRVAHIIGRYMEGLGYEENYLGFFQASLGAEVSIVTSTMYPVGLRAVADPDRLPDDAEPGVRVDRGVEIHRVKPGFQARGGTQIVLRGLRGTLKAIGPDILHVHGPVGILTAQALVAAKSLDIPVVIDNHLCYFNLAPYGLVKRLYYHAFGRTVLRRYSSIIRRYLPLTRDCEEVLHAELGVPVERMTHTTLGADTDVFDFRPSAREQVRQSLGIPTDAPVVAFAGRISSGKEVEVLVAAWSRLARKHGAYLALIGSLTESMRGFLATPVDETLKGMLKITGHVPHSELPDYLSACDIGVWPGDPGVSVIEAMACHLAIVCTDPGAVGHLVAYGNGGLFARGDGDELVSMLDAILGNRGRLEFMRQESRRLAEDVFDWRVVAARTNSVYDAALLGKEPSLPAIWERVR